MATFTEANQVRNSLKIKLSNFAWYNDSVVTLVNDGYSVLIHVSKIDNFVRKTIPPLVNNVEIKVEIN